MYEKATQIRPQSYGDAVGIAVLRKNKISNVNWSYLLSVEIPIGKHSSSVHRRSKVSMSFAVSLSRRVSAAEASFQWCKLIYSPAPPNGDNRSTHSCKYSWSEDYAASVFFGNRAQELVLHCIWQVVEVYIALGVRPVARLFRWVNRYRYTSLPSLLRCYISIARRDGIMGGSCLSAGCGADRYAQGISWFFDCGFFLAGLFFAKIYDYRTKSTKVGSFVGEESHTTHDPTNLDFNNWMVTPRCQVAFGLSTKISGGFSPCLVLQDLDILWNFQSLINIDFQCGSRRHHAEGTDSSWLRLKRFRKHLLSDIHTILY